LVAQGGDVVRGLFSTPGVLRVFLCSVVSRLPMGAVALILILRTRELTGSYAAGGLVAAANALGHGLLGPVLGRLVDRRGQSLVLAVAGAVHGAALVAFALLPAGAPLGAAVACAAVAGAAMPPTGPCLRAIWGTRIEDADLRHTAYSFEATVFEVVYIAGPIVFVGLIGAASLPAAAAAAGVVTAAGAWLFAAAPASRAWRPEGERTADRAGALRGPGVRVILLALFVLGIAIAAVEIGVAAFAGSEERAAVLLALWGVGSLIGGVISTRRSAPADPPAQMAVLLGVMAVLTLPLALDVEFTVFGALMVVAGLAIAPSLATGFGLLGQVAPAGTVTEAYTWVATGMGGGIALGSALGGWIVESSGTAPAFVLAAVAVGTAGAIVFAGAGTLRAEHGPHLATAAC
jgi:predicted MFS family arabinose efflux permease